MASYFIYLISWLILGSLMLLTWGEQSSTSIPIFQEEPHDVVVTKGSSLLLNCRVNSTTGPVHVTWRKDNVEVDTSSSRRVQIYRNGSLYFRRIVHRKKRGSDAGVYVCVVEDDNGVIVSRPARVQVAMLGRFLTNPQPVTAPELGVARFSCQVRALPHPVYTWMKDNQTLPADLRFTALHSGVLQIAGIQASDAGAYSCVATNQVGERISMQAVLTVSQGGPSLRGLKILGVPQNITVVQGQSALLECLVDSQPLPDIEWKREDGKAIRSSGISTIGQGNLYFEKIESADAGVYICHARVSTSTISQKANITVHTPPIITEHPDPMEAPVAMSKRMTCKFEGVPKPSIQWLKNGALLDFSGRIKLVNQDDHEETIMVSQIILKDAGYYQCVVKNAAGVTSAVTHLKVRHSNYAPDAPQGLRVLGVTSTAVNLTWQPVENPLLYTVHYSLTESKIGREKQKISHPPNATIGGLLPHQNYTFYVVAYRTKGASEHSNYITVLTNEDVPIKAPEIKKLISNSESSINVYWAPINEEHARGEIIGYKVYYQEYNQPNTEKEVECDRSRRYYVITGLRPSTRYQVRVLGRTHKGYPAKDNWPWKTVTTLARPDPSAPPAPKMTLTVLSETAINISWTVSSPEEVSMFRIKYRGQSDNWETIEAEPSEFNHYISELTPGTSYEFRLWAVRGSVEGVPARDSARTWDRGNSPPKVYPPEEIQAHAVSATTMRVLWKKPEYTQNDILKYTVKYYPGQQSNDTKTVELSGKSSGVSPGVMLEKLAPYTIYSISVNIAVHVRGMAFSSDFSSPLHCRTKESKPGSAPYSLRLLILPPDKVNLSWKPPRIKNGEIIKYTIFYHHNQQEENEWAKQVQNGSVTFTTIKGLENQREYLVKVQAATKAGNGPESNALHFTLPVSNGTAAPPGGNKTGQITDSPDATHLGIIIGIAIGVLCVIMCIVLVLVRKRMVAYHRRHSSTRNDVTYSNGHVHMNGGHLAGKRLADPTSPEYDSFTPMLNSSVPENEHLDTKGPGGTPIPRRKYNGIAYVPNGPRINGLSSQLRKKYGVEADMETPDSQRLLQTSCSEQDEGFHEVRSSGSDPSTSNYLSADSSQGAPSNTTDDTGNYNTLEGSGKSTPHQNSCHSSHTSLPCGDNTSLENRKLTDSSHKLSGDLGGPPPPDPQLNPQSRSQGNTFQPRGMERRTPPPSDIPLQSVVPQDTASRQTKTDQAFITTV